MAVATNPRPSQTMPALAVVTFVVIGIVGGGPTSPTLDSCSEPIGVVQPAAAVTWPPSTGLLVSEVLTGGASGSDEFVEIYNASAQVIDLAGLEIVYATSTGSTVTRKQTWTSFPLAAHAHLLLANSAGVFAAGADGLYSGGFSAAGGSLVLRVVGGATIDSLSWGDATSAFVEGTAGIAPAAQFSLERLPGGALGNAADSNDNVADTWINSSPAPQSTASEPVPALTPTPSFPSTPGPTPSPTSSPTATPEPTSEPTPQPTPDPTASPTLQPTAEPTPAPTAEPTTQPTLSPTPQPTAWSPTPTSTPQPTPAPTVLCTPEPTLTSPPTAQPTATPHPTGTAAPSPTPSPHPSPTPTTSATATPTPAPTASVVPIAAARTQAIGSRVVVRGVVTVAPGWILGDLTTAIQDDTAGIFVKLPQMPVDGIVPGRELQVDGVLAAPYGNLEIRPSSAGVQLLALATLPAPTDLTLDQLGESTEGTLAHVEGTIKRIDSSGVTSLTLIIEHNTSEGRVFAHSTLGVSRDDYSPGQRIGVTGLIGDRLGLYRIWPRNRFDIVETEPAPTPTPSATPRPHPSHPPQPTQKPQPTRPSTPTRTPRPSNQPNEVSISEALRKQGEAVTVAGVATTRNGLLDADGQRVTLQDASGAILVRLPAGVTAQPGQRIRVSGEVGTYYNAPQLTATAATRVGDTTVQPLQVRIAPVAAALEWRLIVVSGKIESVRRDGDTWRAELSMQGGGIPIVGVARSGIASIALVEGREATVTGIVKRAYPTASDQRFGIVPRASADIKLGQEVGGPAGPSSAPGMTNERGEPPPQGSQAASGGSSDGSSMAPGSSGTQAPRPQAVPLGELGAYLGMRVSVGGEVVAAQAGRVSIDDGTGTATVVVTGAAAGSISAASAGDLLNATGVISQPSEGAFEILVDDPLALSWLDLTDPSLSASLGPTASAASAAILGIPMSNGSTSDTRIVAMALLFLALLATGAALLASPARRQRLQAWLANATLALKQRLATLRSS